MTEKIIYAKGGRAIEEAQALFPRIGELPDGGPDKFLLAVLFHARDAQFRLASLGPRNEAVKILGREAIEYGARPTKGGKLHRRMGFFNSAFKFLRDTVAYRPTRILCGLDGPFGLFAWLASVLCGADFIFLAHGAMDLSSASKSYRWSNRFLCRRASWVITHGPFVHQEALNFGVPAERVLEFNNGLDPEHVGLIKALPDKTAEGRTIFYLGRMEADKGVFDLLTAFLALPAKLPLKLAFIGGGSAVPELLRQVDAGGFASRVQVMGPLPFEEIFVHLRAAAVVVTPSRSIFPEGFCKAAMEAFYVGTPVIAPDYGPFPYLVQHEQNGLLYPSDSIPGLQAALERYFTEQGLRSRLELGAVQSGAALVKPRLSFSAAVRTVLAVPHD